jgi:hypothetical protein
MMLWKDAQDSQKRIMIDSLGEVILKVQKLNVQYTMHNPVVKVAICFVF